MRLLAGGITVLYDASMSPTLFLAGMTIVVTHTIGATIGFGSAVLAFPLVTILLGIEEAKVVLATISWLLAVYIVVAKSRHINFRHFLIILGFTAVGMPAGIYFFNNFAPTTLKLILGIFVIATASLQLKQLYYPAQRSRRVPQLIYYVLLVLGGVIHGAFASGGPLIVLYAGKNIEDKGEFRATLCLLWVSLNLALFFTDPTFRPVFGSLAATVFHVEPLAAPAQRLLWMLPFLAIAIIAGELIHGRLKSEVFRKVVYITLLITGILMIISP